MKTVLTAATLTLTLGLSSVAHAEFKDQGPLVEPNPARMTPQDVSHLPLVTNFNDQSHHAKAAVSQPGAASRAPLVIGANCDLNPVDGFQNSQSVATC